MTADAWIPWLRCPRCAGPCSADPIACDECGFAYPTYDGIPVLMARPHELVEQWRFRLAEFETTTESTRTRIIADAATLPLRPGTRARLERLAQGLATHREIVVGLLGEAGITPTRRTAPEPAGVPTEGSISAYIHHIHRDWGWDEDGSTENRDSLAAVQAVLEAPPRLGAMLVLGAGACRLASELHRLGAELTVAVDINPLPMIVARRVLAGERVRLLELPLAPPDLAHVAVERSLHSAAGPAQGFVQIFADAFALPFEGGCFDTVLTPWFIDQVPRDIADLLPEIRRLLKPTGRWINHGPLIYAPSHTPTPARYPADELFALIETSGFAVARRREDRLTYLQSPACTRGRSELVLSFVATVDAVRTEDGPTVDAPAWTEDPTVPVPRFEGLLRYVAPHPLFATVATLVDGERTADAIAAILVRDYALPTHAATAGVLGCLREIWRATR